MTIPLDTPAGPEIVTLINVAYIPDFLTNVAALNLFAAKGVHFDSSILHMHRQSKTVFHIYRLGGHYTFTNAHDHVAAVSTPQIYATTKKTRTANEWHSIMAHASHDVLRHLQEVHDPPECDS